MVEVTWIHIRLCPGIKAAFWQVFGDISGRCRRTALRDVKKEPIQRRAAPLGLNVFYSSTHPLPGGLSNSALTGWFFVSSPVSALARASISVHEIKTMDVPKQMRNPK